MLANHLYSKYEINRLRTLKQIENEKAKIKTNLSIKKVSKVNVRSNAEKILNEIV